MRFKDAYESLIDAIYSAASRLGISPNIIPIDTTKINEVGGDFDCIIIAGGAGKEGTEDSKIHRILKKKQNSYTWYLFWNAIYGNRNLQEMFWN